MPRFDLIDEPWIPCLMIEGGRTLRLGLLETLIRAPSIREVVDPSPLVTVALHRLLLAVVHRNFGPGSVAEWSQLWEAGRFDEAKLRAYFDKWRHRFDLFDEHHPFYQVAGLPAENQRSVANLTQELASSGNKMLIFDHSVDCTLPPDSAARYLLAYQSYALGGTISHGKNEPAALFKFAKGAPMVKGAVVVVKGESLFRTLLLNLCQYDPSAGMPFEGSTEDRPAWERDEPTDAGKRELNGYLDLLTWQSRRVRLCPEASERGGIIVRRAILMKGYQFMDDFHRRGRETMVAFRKARRAGPHDDPWPAVSFDAMKAVWRDSLALFQSASDEQQAPRTIEWLSALADRGLLDYGQVVPLDLLGAATDQASMLLWRHERLPLPLAYLRPENRDLVGALREALRHAEAVGKALRICARSVATLIAAPDSDEPGGRQPNGDTVERLRARLTAEGAYWARLEVPFRQLVVDLPEDRREIEEGSVEYGANAKPIWARLLRESALDSFAEAVDGLDASPRGAKATAKAEQQLRVLLGRELNDWLRPEEVV